MQTYYFRNNSYEHIATVIVILQRSTKIKQLLGCYLRARVFFFFKMPRVAI